MQATLKPLRRNTAIKKKNKTREICVYNKLLGIPPSKKKVIYINTNV